MVAYDIIFAVAAYEQQTANKNKYDRRKFVLHKYQSVLKAAPVKQDKKKRLNDA